MTNSQVTGFDVTTQQAVGALTEMRRAHGHVFVPDSATLAQPVIDVTPMVGTEQVTDFHLVNLAAAAEMILATLTRRCPGCWSTRIDGICTSSRTDGRIQVRSGRPTTPGPRRAGCRSGRSSCRAG